MIDLSSGIDGSPDAARTQKTASGLDIRPVLTHRFPIGEFQKGFDVMRSGQSGKVVLDCG